MVQQLLRKNAGALKSSSDRIRKQFGASSELAVVRLLQQRGYTILATNFSCRGGELDIVAKIGTTVAFVEVKSRVAPSFPLSTVITASKQRKIAQAARYFVRCRNLSQVALRFDVAMVYGAAAEQTIDYIEHAFEVRQYD